ncbi:OmpA family protein [Maritimibacter sp. DP1N21-5]|uniref:OmpA family protein n=1 Tax=Maritimibacter sp. DP1N21-5 TaxID=2836867 RepID=UPI001C4438A4|nr:OmpA family protein [Maritimibacter sp. DP1N21-5]MBV7407612.1 OmpA family protein [Maritimibacter sp. DP1N21-5]
MRLTKALLAPAVFVAAALIAIIAAWSAVGAIERVSKSAIENALILQGEDWATVETDGLQVILTGMAPSENARFKAISVAGGEVDSSRVIDRMEVPSAKAVTPPRFSVEILRNDAGISMIGLVPAATDREELGRRIGRINPDRAVADFLESADYAVPEGWDAVLDFAISALEELPRSKISMDASRVEIEAIADSEAQKKAWETDLARRAPGGLRLALNISAPRPVITPFTARFVIDEDGARFDACTAHTEQGRTRIVAAGIAAGVEGRPNCTIGLGVPSPDWPDAVAMGIAALRELGAGTITFSDADVSLVAAASVEQRNFDRVVGELETDLPDVFSLHASKTAREDAAQQGAEEFVATLSSEGQVQLRGRVASEQDRAITETVARSRFGMDRVYAATRLDPDLPPGWSNRVLVAVEALSYLDSGTATVKPDIVELRGSTGDQGASDEISRILSDKLGTSQDFRVNVTYDEALDPEANLPSPEECVAQINDVMRGAKITFAPGSVEIEARAAPTIDKIADILRNCPDAPMEIGGHTDSQGSEELNKSLSQQRANSVLNALLARRILTANLTAHGYGEEQPIGDNDTEEGREDNRRIEFRLIGSAELPETGALMAEGTEVIEEGTPSNAELAAIRPRPRPESVLEAAAAAGEEAGTDEASGDEGSGDEPPAEDTEATVDDEIYVPGDAGPEGETTADESAADDGADEAPEDEAVPAGTEGSGDDSATADADQTIPADEAELVDTEGEDAGELAAPDAPVTDAPEETEAEETASDALAGDDTGTLATTDDGTEGAVPVEQTAETTEDTVENAGETDQTATDTTTLGPPVVVHPELEGVRPPPRPDR